MLFQPEDVLKVLIDEGNVSSWCNRYQYRPTFMEYIRRPIYYSSVDSVLSHGLMIYALRSLPVLEALLESGANPNAVTLYENGQYTSFLGAIAW